MYLNSYSKPLSVAYDIEASDHIGRDLWKVLDGFRYYVGHKGSDVWVDVPYGYLTDGASVPRPFWSIASPWGRYGQAAVTHDWLCEYLIVNTSDGFQPITRERADQIFLEAMSVLDVSVVQRRIMWRAVNLYRRMTSTDNAQLDLKKQDLEMARRRLEYISEKENVESAPDISKIPSVPSTSKSEVVDLLEGGVTEDMEDVVGTTGEELLEIMTMDVIIADKTNIEDGYVNHPDDLGGETNHGITAAVANANRSDLVDMFGWDGTMINLTTEMAYHIYVKDYWKPLKLDEIREIDPCIADKLFDIGINIGIARAGIWLQTIINVCNRKGELYPDLVIDGIVGSNTIDRFHDYISTRGDRAIPRMLTALICVQGNHYITISRDRGDNESFTWGWLARLGHNFDYYYNAHWDD